MVEVFEANISTRMKLVTMIEGQVYEAYWVERNFRKLREQLQEIEDEITVQVLTAIDASGKSLFTNDRTREIEIRRRLKNCDEYQSLLAVCYRQEEAKIKETAYLERLRNEFRLLLREGSQI